MWNNELRAPLWSVYKVCVLQVAMSCCSGWRPDTRSHSSPPGDTLNDHQGLRVVGAASRQRKDLMFTRTFIILVNANQTSSWNISPSFCVQVYVTRLWYYIKNDPHSLNETQSQDMIAASLNPTLTALPHKLKGSWIGLLLIYTNLLLSQQIIAGDVISGIELYRRTFKKIVNWFSFWSPVK